MSRTPFWQPRGARRRGVLLVLALGGLLVLAICGASAAATAGAAPHRIILDPAATPSWSHAFHGPGASADAAVDVALAANGVAYIAGNVGDGLARDASLMKLIDGVPAWATPKTYDSPYHSVDETRRIALGPGDAIYTSGTSLGASGLPDMLLLKWSASGAVKWARRYDGPAHGADQAMALTVDSAGNVTVGGYSADGTSVDWMVVSWSASGGRRWTSRSSLGVLHEMYPMDLVAAKDRSVYASGIAATVTDASAMTVRYSPAGKTLWKDVYAGPAGLRAMTYAAAARPGGGVYVCGTTTSVGTGSDGLVMSYTPTGERDVFALDVGPGGAGAQQFKDLAVTSTKQVVAVGSTTSGVSSDCRAVSYSTAGTIAGQVTLPGAWDDRFVAVAADSFGGFYATGTYHSAVDKTGILTVRGSVLIGGGGFLSLWAPAFVSVDNEPHAIAVRGSTAVVAGECKEGAAQGVDQIVLGYVY